MSKNKREDLPLVIDRDGYRISIIDMCWCRKEPKRQGRKVLHERGCARERKRRGLK